MANARVMTRWYDRVMTRTDAVASWPWLDAYTGPPMRFAHPTDRWRPQQFRYLGTTGTLLYRMWDTDRRLLYAGISRNPVERWAKHRLLKPWWPEVDLIGYALYPTEWKALTAEVVAIRTELPRYNIRSAVR
jgi:GIY-YIG catalytic domain